MWDRCFPGFNRCCRDLEARDATPSAVTAIREAVETQVREMRRERFLAKYTGWPRIGFMDHVFPRARYIHILRDGRAVAWSLLHVSWWEGWRGPEQWRWGPLSDADARAWQDSDRSFFVLAGLQWKTLADRIAARGAEIGDRYLQVRFEQLVQTPEEVVAGALDWAGLRRDAGFLQVVRSRAYRDADQRWRQEVSPEELARFEAALGPALRHHGYGPE
jgi:hypothetical protein